MQVMPKGSVYEGFCLLDNLNLGSYNHVPTPSTHQSFHALKKAMFTTHVLTLPNFTETFVLECDALGKGIGVVLMQYGNPLDFTSKQLSERHLGQLIYEKEMLSILHAMDLYHPYLLGK
jgi:hypothetical protein